MSSVKNFFKKVFGIEKAEKDSFALGRIEEGGFEGGFADKYGVYTLGDPDPRAFTQRENRKRNYTAFSSMDVQVYIDDELIDSITSVQIGPEPENNPVFNKNMGSLEIILTKDSKYTKWLGKELNFALVAALEGCSHHTFYNTKVKFEEHETFVASVYSTAIRVCLYFAITKRLFSEYEIPPKKTEDAQ